MHWGRVNLPGGIGIGAIRDGSMLLYDREPYAGGRPTGEIASLADVRWLTPCVPGKLIALWNNFHAAAAKNGWSIPEAPLYFLKAPNSYNAHLEPIVQPQFYDGRVVYEGELGIVIGRECRAISVSDAAAHIFGYTCINDVTAIDLLNRDPGFPQWTRAKGFDGFGVVGPAIATDLDPHGLIVRTLVNGRERQNYSVGDMIFAPFELVSRISQDMTLFPGDIIACGTSLGVLPMRDGAVVEVAIDGVGALKNTFKNGIGAT